MPKLGKLIVIVLVFIFIATLLFLWFAYSSNTNLTWNIQVVDDRTWGGGSLALDSNNQPCIAYTHYEYKSGLYRNRYLTYATLTNSNWNLTRIDMGHSPSLALDKNNIPQIIYQGEVIEPFFGKNDTFPSENGLMYAYINGTSWVTQVIDKKGAYGCLDLDSLGNPHVAYINNNTVMYASLKGSNWTTEKIDSFETLLPPNLSMQLDSKNNPHILYGYIVREPTNNPDQVNEYQTVKYLTCNGTAWDIKTLLNGVESFSPMVLDSNDCLHFLYIEKNSQPAWLNVNLTYAILDSTGLKTKFAAVNASFSSGYLSLDYRDNPHFDYSKIIDAEFGGTTEELSYVQWIGTNWISEKIESGGSGGPLIVDLNGNPHLISTSNIAGTYYSVCKYISATRSIPDPSVIFPYLMVMIAIITILVLVKIVMLFRGRRKTVAI